MEEKDLIDTIKLTLHHLEKRSNAMFAKLEEIEQPLELVYDYLRCDISIGDAVKINLDKCNQAQIHSQLDKDKIYYVKGIKRDEQGSQIYIEEASTLLHWSLFDKV